MDSLESMRLDLAKKATRWAFLICGVGLSSWVPMVPFVKDRLGINEADLGILLLALGLGALLMMPLASYFINKIGSRKVIVLAAFVFSITLPLLMYLDNYYAIGFALFFFGGGIGMIDVSMNFHGVMIQKKSEKTIMSSLHGLFSVGGLIGALGFGFLIKLGLNPMYASIIISALLLGLVCSQYSKFYSFEYEKQINATENFDSREDSKRKNVWFNITILMMGLMCFSSFISEGAMLDWSAIYLRDEKSVSLELTGIGFAVFSIAMAVMRLLGDQIIEKLGDRLVVIGGCLMGVLGLLLMIFSNWLLFVLLGFLFLGLGLANIIPLLFGAVGKMKNVPTSSALAVVTIMGYAGQLVGPALLGYVAFEYSLNIAFGVLIFLLVMVSIIYSIISKQ